MTCEHALNEGPLRCLRIDPHDRGHVYEASSAPDLHDISEQAAERTQG